MAAVAIVIAAIYRKKVREMEREMALKQSESRERDEIKEVTGEEIKAEGEAEQTTEQTTEASQIEAAQNDITEQDKPIQEAKRELEKEGKERGKRGAISREHLDIESVEEEIFEEYVDGSMTASDRVFLRRLTGYIEKNIDSSELVVNKLCDFMGMTQLVLNKKLKSLVGMTANNFIRTVRLRRAAQLLRTARYTVSDVTYDVGFSDLRYFRECFKREFGALPQEYKDQRFSGERKRDETSKIEGDVSDEI